MVSTESKYSKLTSNKRNEESKRLLSNLYSLKLFDDKVKKNMQSGNYTIEDLISDMKHEINELENNIQEIDEVEKNKFKIFYPDPCNENECAMCGKERKDHFHHDSNNKHRPFCNNF